MPHCWQGLYEDTEERTGRAWWHTLGDDHPGGTCVLEDGHDGPHAFTPDDGIVLTFGGEELQ